MDSSCAWRWRCSRADASACAYARGEGEEEKRSYESALETANGVERRGAGDGVR